VQGEEEMTFAPYYVFGLLDSMGWPRKKRSLLFYKKVVALVVLQTVIQNMVETGIALGIKKPKVATSLLADLFSKRDWINEGAEGLWSVLDPSEKINSQPNLYPPKAIMNCYFNDFFQDSESHSLIEWKFITTEVFCVHCSGSFANGLVWGLGYPRDASIAYEDQRQRLLKRDRMRELLEKAGAVVVCSTLDELSDTGEKVVDLFAKTVRPFAKTPPELISLPQIASRIISLPINKNSP